MGLGQTLKFFWDVTLCWWVQAQAEKKYLGLPEGEHEDTTVLRNVRNNTPNNIASRPRLESSAISLRENQISRSLRTLDGIHGFIFLLRRCIWIWDCMAYHDEHCFDCHTESSDLVEGQVLCSLSRLITLLCTVLLAQQLTRCEREGGETLITVLVRSVC